MLHVGRVVIEFKEVALALDREERYVVLIVRIVAGVEGVEGSNSREDAGLQIGLDRAERDREHRRAAGEGLPCVVVQGADDAGFVGVNVHDCLRLSTRARNAREMRGRKLCDYTRTSPRCHPTLARASVRSPISARPK